MATEILATDDTAATSTEVTVADGSTATVGIKDAAFGASLVVEVEVAGSPSEWEAIGFVVANAGERIKTLGPGTYRLRRAEGVMAGGFRA